MLGELAESLELLAALVTPKSAVGPQPVSSSSPAGYVDSLRRIREPTPRDLLAELKSTAFACAFLNASVCAMHRPRLYVVTRQGEAAPKCPVRDLSDGVKKSLESDAQAMSREPNLQRWKEVIEHPLLTLLNKPNDWITGHDLMEQTTLQQECIGACYWKLEFDALDVPAEVWPLASHLIRPVRKQGSQRPVDYYEYWTAPGPKRFEVDEIIDFRYPDPKDPYTGALAPLRGSYESALLNSKYNAIRSAVFDNNAVPGVIISPKEVVSDPERRRLETEWNQRFGRGKQGSVLVAESSLEVDIISQQLGDLAALAEARFSKEDICNAYGVPMAFFVSESNRANLEAAREQHVGHAIKTRLDRRDSRLNMKLIPLYDPTGRLFLKTTDPDPRSQEVTLKQEDQDVRLGVRTINDIRAVRGLLPVEWGNTPWLSLDWAPTDYHRREVFARASGRNADPDRWANKPGEKPAAE